MPTTKSKTKTTSKKTMLRVRGRMIDPHAESLSEMDRAAIRVIIAKDVIKNLAAEKIVATHGLYISDYFESYQANFKSKSVHGEFLSRKPIKVKLSKKAPCEACALGATFICAIDKLNQLTPRQFSTLSGSFHSPGPNDPRTLQIYLGQWFDYSVLAEIEEFFEVGYASEGWMNLDPRTRLRKIMQNIVTNKGTFQPKKLPGYRGAA